MNFNDVSKLDDFMVLGSDLYKAAMETIKDYNEKAMSQSFASYKLPFKSYEKGILKIKPGKLSFTNVQGKQQIDDILAKEYKVVLVGDKIKFKAISDK